MKILFAGPSICHDRELLAATAPDIALRGPAKRGDLAQATADGASAIALVDGVFDDIQSVWHKEILFALSRGIRVAGGASMGALRAAECDAFGMIGLGAIYQRYRDGEITDDAAVAQLHGPSELGYFPLTDPLVNVEPTLAKLESAGVVNPEVVLSLKVAARRLHYRERTYDRIFAQSAGLSGEDRAVIADWIAANAVDQKRIDAWEVIRWLCASPAERDLPPRDWRFQATTQWLSLWETIDRRSEPVHVQ
jgi:hypothetical protein